MSRQSYPLTDDPPVPTETTDLLSSDDFPVPSTQESQVALPTRSAAYQCFMMISAFAVLVSAMLLCAQIAAFSLWKSISIEDLLRVYIIAFCVMFILAELKVDAFLKLLPSFNNWVYRGFLYSFVGVIGAEMSRAMLASIPPNSLSVLQRGASLMLSVTSYSMAIVGALYMLMGVCCLHGVWENIKAGYDREIDKVAVSEDILVR